MTPTRVIAEKGQVTETSKMQIGSVASIVNEYCRPSNQQGGAVLARVADFYDKLVN
jgi:hypothetical protein